MKFATKRIYEPKENSDGFRILVDRLWPRGISKSEADIDLWVKEIAPSESLRKWFGHDVTRWQGFIRRYNEELSENKGVTDLLEQSKEHSKVTLVYSAKDVNHNNAVVLRDFLKKFVDGKQ
jgi:uncharacterized protein YeaO (DUF488 family)